MKSLAFKDNNTWRFSSLEAACAWNWLPGWRNVTPSNTLKKNDMPQGSSRYVSDLPNPQLAASNQYDSMWACAFREGVQWCNVTIASTIHQTDEAKEQKYWRKNHDWQSFHQKMMAKLHDFMTLDHQGREKSGPRATRTWRGDNCLHPTLLGQLPAIAVVSLQMSSHQD